MAKHSSTNGISATMSWRGNIRFQPIGLQTRFRLFGRNDDAFNFTKVKFSQYFQKMSTVVQ